jgi:hypothetical protein
MLNGVKAGAFRKHPAGEDPLHLPLEIDLVDLDEGGRVRRLGGGRRVAHPRRDLQRAELDRLIDRDLEMRDAPSDLIECGEHRDRVLDRIGIEGVREKPHRRRKGDEKQETSRANHAVRGSVTSFDHAAHLLNGGLNGRSGALHAVSMIVPANRHPIFRIMLRHQTPRPGFGHGCGGSSQVPRSAKKRSLIWSAVHTPLPSQRDGLSSSTISPSTSVRSGS